MENRTERFSEEKIYCHTYDGLVREMASAMEVDSKKLFPEKEGEFDYEDIESWIGAVKFKEGKVPDIQASLSSDRGLKVVKFDVADQKGIESLDEKATKEELIYTMALTEAKMKVISDIAEEVYPAVAFQIGDYRKEMEKVRDEILGDKKENTSLDEVINRVMSKKTLAAALIIGGLVLSACGVSIETVTPKATATETQPRVTETVEIGVTETPFQSGVTETAPEVSETPFVENTPDVENERALEIMKQVDLFLGEKAPYTESDISMAMFKEPKWKGEVDLGVITVSEVDQGIAIFQGVFLGYLEGEDGIIMYMGEQDEQGKRFVTPLKLYDQIFEAQKEFGRAFLYTIIGKDWDFSDTEVIVKKDKSEVMTTLDERVGMVLGYQLTLKRPGTLDDDSRNFLINNGVSDPELMHNLIAEIMNNTAQNNVNLLNSVWYPSSETIKSPNFKFLISQNGQKNDSPMMVSSAEDLVAVTKAGLWIPLPNGFFGFR